MLSSSNSLDARLEQRRALLRRVVSFGPHKHCFCFTQVFLQYRNIQTESFGNAICYVSVPSTDSKPHVSLCPLFFEGQEMQSHFLVCTGFAPTRQDIASSLVDFLVLNHPHPDM
jgi:hypothetical protein